MHNKVSVIVPIYNVCNYIERCVCSLFEQTLKEIEYIFVDDASPDDSIDVLKLCIEKYPERKEQVVIITHDRNKGLTAARNTGLAVATGKYVAHCDSDDFVDKDMYRLLYEKAEKTNASLVYCDFYFRCQGNRLERYNTVPLLGKVDHLKSYIASQWTVIWNMIAKKELYEKYNLLSPSTATFCEDFHLSVRLMFYATSISKVDLPLYYYNQENINSIMHNLNTRHVLEERIVYCEIVQFLEENKCLGQYEREISWRILKNKQYDVLDAKLHHEFLQKNPWSHKYILSCPTRFCNRKIKFMMWLLAHRCRYMLLPILWLRKLLKR